MSWELGDYSELKDISEALRAIRDSLGYIGQATLRDRFAMAALPDMLDRTETSSVEAQDAAFERAISLSYKIADAMFEARKESES